MKAEADPPLALTLALCRSTREARGWTVRRLAMRVGLSAATVERCESAPDVAHLGTIGALRRALELDRPVVRGAADVGPPEEPPR